MNNQQFFISVDLGQAADFTAVSVLETRQGSGIVNHLERFPLGLSYVDQVNQIKLIHQFVSRLTNNPTLIVDFTGVGRPISNYLTDAGLRHVKISITGGDQEHRDGDEWRVPKRNLVSSFLIALQTGKLKIASGLLESETLIKELQNFKMKINVKTGHDSYEAWREGVHDDLVLSVAMGVHISGLWKMPDRSVSRPTPRRDIWPSNHRKAWSPAGFDRSGRGGRIAGW